MSDTPNQSPQPTFADFLRSHKNGVTNADLTELWRELVDTVARVEKGGSLTLTFKLSKEGDMVGVVDDVKVKLPNIAETRLYWADIDGNLTQRHPLQPSLPYDQPTTNPAG